MNKDLDRLLEIHQQRGFYHQFDLCQDEEKKLKSQIESKLAEAKYWKELSDHNYDIAEKYEQELSQLRPIVQALREEFEKNEDRLIETGNAQFYNKMKTILESKNAV